MKKRTKSALSLLYAGLFFAACAIPGAMLWSKRANAPALRQEDGSVNEAWQAQVQDFVSENFGFRDKLIVANGKLQAGLLHQSAEEDVILGTDGWLYYTPTVEDYLGVRTVSDEGMKNILHNLEMMNEYVESHGGKFVVAVVPNKNTIYPQYMPYQYRESGREGNLEALTALLEESGIAYADLKQALGEVAAQAKTPIYHLQDTHWNNTGALVGYREIMEAAGMMYESYEEVTPVSEQSWDGDLQGMLFPDSGVKDWQDVYPVGTGYRYLGHYRGTDDISIRTMKPGGQGQLLMFRDSFGAAIIPFFSESFQTATYSRARPNPFSQIETTPADLVVLEIVERNIAWLQKEAPLHAAPEVENVPRAEAHCDAVMYSEENGNLLQIYGYFDAKAAGECYVTLSQGDQTHSYRAYRCYEAEKLGEEKVLDNGYSLYIPRASLAPGRYAVTLTIQTEEGVYTGTPGEVEIA